MKSSPPKKHGSQASVVVSAGWHTLFCRRKSLIWRLLLMIYLLWLFFMICLVWSLPMIDLPFSPALSLSHSPRSTSNKFDIKHQDTWVRMVICSTKTVLCSNKHFHSQERSFSIESLSVLATAVVLCCCFLFFVGDVVCFAYFVVFPICSCCCLAMNVLHCC